MPFRLDFALILPTFAFHFLFIVPFFAMCRQHQCPSPIFRSHDGQNNNLNSSIHSKHRPTNNPFHFYALTQDCQFIIARPDQLNKLSSLRILAHSNECHPNRVQLIWSMKSSQPSLQLLHKRNAHEICILPVEMPIPLAIQGTELFIYSLRSALIRFAKCSRPSGPPNSSNSRPLIVDPQLIFPDSIYSDLLYQISVPTQLSQNWTLDQFQISSRGHLYPIQLFRIQSMQKGIAPMDLMLSIDPQRKRIFAVPKNLGKKNSQIEWTCPFDLISRPNQAKFHRFHLFPINSESTDQSIMTGFSVDRHIAIFTVEKGQNTEVFLSKLDITGKGHSAETRCVLRMSFAAKFGVISELTLNELNNKGPLPSIGNKVVKVNGLMDHSTTTTTKPPFWHRYTNSPLMSTTSRQNRQTSKIADKSIQQYFWHRTTTTMSSIKATSTEQIEAESDDDREAVEAWNEDYDGEEEGEKNEEEEEDKEEQERILPLAEEDTEEKTPSPAKIISDENGAAQKSGQISSRMNLNLAATFWAIALLIGILRRA